MELEAGHPKGNLTVSTLSFLYSTVTEQTLRATVPPHKQRQRILLYILT